MAEANETDNAPNGTEIKETEKVAEAPPVRQPKPVTITDIELETVQKEAQEYKDKYLRELAETENTRKRLQKERQELVQYALQNLIVDFLSPIDHMENALGFTQQAPDEVKHWAVGFQMILGQFKDVLSNNGVVPFTSKGEQFDHHRHEAVEAVETSEVLPGTVVEESIRGYKMGDKTIRPARVKVAKAPSPLSEVKSEEEIANKEEQSN